MIERRANAIARGDTEAAEYWHRRQLDHGRATAEHRDENRQRVENMDRVYRRQA